MTSVSDQAAIDAIVAELETMTPDEILALGGPIEAPAVKTDPAAALAAALAYRATKRPPVAPIESKRASKRPPCGACKFGIRRESRPAFDAAGVQYHPNCLKARDDLEFRANLAPRYVAAIVEVRKDAQPLPAATADVPEAEESLEASA